MFGWFYALGTWYMMLVAGKYVACTTMMIESWFCTSKRSEFY